MGCDIHIHVETFTDNKWGNADIWRVDPWFSSFDEGSEFEAIEVYDGRDYRLFTALADVRCSEGIPVISEPRGLPADVSKQTNDASNSDGSDGHSHSHLLLSELVQYSKDHPKTTFHGMISQKQSKELDEGKLPNGWCGWTSQEGFVKRIWQNDSSVVDGLIKNITDHFPNNMPEAEHVRIVFWFDN